MGCGWLAALRYGNESGAPWNNWTIRSNKLIDTGIHTRTVTFLRLTHINMSLESNVAVEASVF